MEITLTRFQRSENSTISKLSIEDKQECFVLEDKDRGLKQDMPLHELQAAKIHSKTAIPYGRYEIAVTFSNRFKKPLPLLLNVAGFEGIRIHPGNTPENTEGCLLPARKKGKNAVSESTLAFNQLNDKINLAIKAGEVVTIEITK